MTIRKIARNKHGDEIFKRFGDLANRLMSPHWDVFGHQASYAALVSGEKEKGKLMTFSLLRPTLVEKFRSTTIAGACFEDTALYQLWTRLGVEMRPVKAASLRYDVHPNGDVLTIAYVTEEDWSKTLRDRKIAENGKSASVLDEVVETITQAVGQQPFAWMANKDVPASIFDHLPGAVQLPNSPHGLNCFQHLHVAVVLSALNPRSPHFTFMEVQGIDAESLRRAHYWLAIYQAVLRISVRNPADRNPKLVIVMDRNSAEWLAGLFPGASIVSIGNLKPVKGKAGRPRIHASDDARKRAFRLREKQRREEELARLNPQMGWDEISNKKGITSLISPSPQAHGLLPSMGSAFENLYSTEPMAHLPATSPDEFIRLLRDLHQSRPREKEDCPLLSPAHFVPDMPGAESKRGLANITHVNGIWLDNDGGDLTCEEFASLFPYLRMAIWNTYSSTPEEPRWRVFIPTTRAMTVEVHKEIIEQIKRQLAEEGYCCESEIQKKKQRGSNRQWLAHGFDKSKFNAASVFYMPCHGAHPKGSFFIDYNGKDRLPLDVEQWAEEAVRMMKVEPAPILQPPSIAVNDNGNDALANIRHALISERRPRATRIESAIAAWRSTPKGNGHAGFFNLAVALRSAGLEEPEIRAMLNQEAAYAHSPAKRKKEIAQNLKSLRKLRRI